LVKQYVDYLGPTRYTTRTPKANNSLKFIKINVKIDKGKRKKENITYITFKGPS
jgi:hypothetical protein